MTIAKATESIEETARKENSYPVFDLSVCLEFAKIVKDLGGSRNPVKKSILARQIGLAETTPSFFQRISSAKSFGIINGWGSYHLTDIGKLYFYPLTQQAAEAAKLVMLTTPAVFALIVQRFDGEKLPSNEMIGNTLHQEVGIPDSWKDRLASLFVKSAQFLGIIDGAGYLRYDAAVQSTRSTRTESDAGAMLTPEGGTASERMETQAKGPILTQPGQIMAPGANSSVWAFSSKGQSIRLETPQDMPKELWEKLNAYVQILKPSQGTK